MSPVEHSIRAEIRDTAACVEREEAQAATERSLIVAAGGEVPSDVVEGSDPELIARELERRAAAFSVPARGNAAETALAHAVSHPTPAAVVHQRSYLESRARSVRFGQQLARLRRELHVLHVIQEGMR